MAPAIADKPQAVAAFVVYAMNTLLMSGCESWNCRRIMLAYGDYG